MKRSCGKPELEVDRDGENYVIIVISGGRNDRNEKVCQVGGKCCLYFCINKISTLRFLVLCSSE
jgi:hypothetical protein